MSMDHRLRIRGRELDTWCAMDALVIPAGLREHAKIGSRCHHCGTSVNIEIEAGQLGRVEPADVPVCLNGSRGEAG